MSDSPLRCLVYVEDELILDTWINSRLGPLTQHKLLTILWSIHKPDDNEPPRPKVQTPKPLIIELGKAGKL